MTLLLADPSCRRLRQIRGHIGLLLTALMLAATPALAQAPDPALERARIQLESGKVYFERGDYRRAIEQFQSADELKPAAAISFNIAQAYERWAEQISDPVEKAQKIKAAAQNLRTYLQRDPQSSDRGDVGRKADTLEGQLGEVEVQTTPPGAAVRVGDPSAPVAARTPAKLILPRAVHALHIQLPAHRPQTQRVDLSAAAPGRPLQLQLTLAATGATVTLAGLAAGTQIVVDGKAVGTTPLAAPLVLEAGRHQLQASRPGAGKVSRVIDVTAGESLTLELRLRRGPGPLGIGGWTVGAVGVVLAATGIAFGVQALRNKSEFDTCQRNLGTPGADPGGCTGVQSDGRQAQRLSDGLLWPGLALAATGTVLVILDVRRGAAEERRAETPAGRRSAWLPRVTPVLGPGHYGAAADLRF